MAKRVSTVPVSVPGGGWISFAALMIMLSGAFNIILGIAAISGANQIRNDLLFANLEGWGWFILIWGVVQILAGLAIFSGATWGILAGILFAVRRLHHAPDVLDRPPGRGRHHHRPRRPRDLRALRLRLREPRPVAVAAQARAARRRR